MSGDGGILLILDGWGEGPAVEGNAIAAARTPTLDRLRATCSGRLLAASGAAVGLPDGVVGNSEIGHLVMGAGRPLPYDSLLVARQAESGELRAHPLLTQTCAELVANGSALHVVGLCSDGRIHSDLAHFGELLRAAANSGLRQVWMHAITDGRDVADGTAGAYLAQFEALAADAGAGVLATVVGRNFAMDKSGKEELTAKACRLILDGQAERTTSDVATAATTTNGDGWLPPTVIATDAAVRDGDAILFANFRSDRTAPLADMMHDRLVATGCHHVRLLSLTQYDTRAQLPALVPRADASGGLADALEQAGVRSVRVAEQEKFEHVTFYINGRDARSRSFEEHICVPSASADDYVSGPEMNLREVTRQVIDAASRDDVTLVIANLANIDVVGHTGDYAATVAAVEAVDRAVNRICASASDIGRWVMLVGDHGNAEQMLQMSGDGAARPYGGHTDNPVPCVLVPSHGQRLGTEPGTLPSVAPTVLELLGVPAPRAMSEPSLVATSGRTGARAGN